MKKLLSILVYVLFAYAAFGQIPESKRGRPNVISLDHNLTVIDRLGTPNDTLPDAAYGSLAWINDTFYIKNLLRWEKIITANQITFIEEPPPGSYEHIVRLYQSTPPVSPPVGDSILVLAPATVGTDFEGHDNEIAGWNGSAWGFTTAAENDYAYVTTTRREYQLRNGVWVYLGGIAIWRHQGNITAGGPLVGGTNNNFPVDLETNDVVRLRLDTLGKAKWYNYTSADIELFGHDESGNMIDFDLDSLKATITGSQDLQSVTDIGFNTTNPLVSTNIISSANNPANTYAQLGVLSNSGYIAIQNSNSFNGTFQANNLTGNQGYEFPDTTGTFAMGITVNGSTYLSDTKGIVDIGTISGVGSFWPLSGTGLLTGGTTITSNTNGQLLFNGAYTTTANNQNWIHEAPTITFRATASDIAIAKRLAPTFNYSANTQDAVALFIDPTYTNGGGYADTKKTAIRANGNIVPTVNNQSQIGEPSVVYNHLYSTNITSSVIQGGSYSFKDATGNNTMVYINGASLARNIRIGTNVASLDDSIYRVQVFGEIQSHGGNIMQLPTPTITSVTQLGTAGSTTVSYKIVFRTVNGNTTPASTVVTTTTSNATLTTTDKNRITFTCPEGVYYVQVYRTAAGGTPSTTGLIGTFTGYFAGSGNVFDDTGLAGDGNTPPTENTTGTFGIGIQRPTAALHLRAGIASPGGASLKIPPGTLLSVLEDGAVENDGSDAYITIGGVRKSITGTGGGSYTDEEAQDAAAALFTPDNGDIDFTYNDGTPDIAAAIKTGVIVNADIHSSAAIDATKINTGAVDNTEFNYLDGVTSALQTQLGTKAASGANTDITSVLLNQTGLVIKGASSNALTIKPNETYSANRTLNIITNDADRTLTVSGNATVSGTNTGDQTITLTGDVTGSGTGSFAATIAADAVTQAKTANYSANSFWANNTGSSANATDFVFKQVDWATYSETPSWTFSTSAPSGASTAEYTWSQIGKNVEVSFAMAFATPGSGVTAVLLPFPSDLPLPDEPAGFGAANDQLYIGSGGLGQVPTTVINNNKVALRVNAADNGYAFVVQGTSSPIQFCWFTISYRAQ